MRTTITFSKALRLGARWLPSCLLLLVTAVGSLAQGTVWAWGDNRDGELGNGKAAASFTPVQVVGSGGTGMLTGIAAIAAGNLNSLALTNDGAVWAWGDNTFGELGIGNYTTTSSSAPVQVVSSSGAGALTGIAAVSAGYGFSLALVPVQK